MRRGFLSDESVRLMKPELFPITANMHSLLYEKPMPGLHHKKKRRRGVRVSKFPYMVRDFANPNPQIAEFGENLSAALQRAPSKSFEQVVDEWNAKYPVFATSRGTLKETAFYMQQLGIDPHDHFMRTTNHGLAINPKRMRDTTVNSMHEEIFQPLIGSGDAERIFKVNEVFKKTLEHRLKEEREFKTELEQQADSPLRSMTLLFGDEP